VQVCPQCGEENPPRFRLCGYCGTPLAAELPKQEVRKTVSVVFSDLKGSTALGERLDSEALREVMARYFFAMQTVLEEHGGTIEKFIGDAVMAVFGLPRVREDDALRAVRAAHGMSVALDLLNEDLDRLYGVRLANRTGVNTGEVVASDGASDQRLVTGDAVNVAARLEQAAGAGEVLIGEPTYRLVRDRVEVEEVEPLELKGKSERVAAYRVVRVRAPAEAAPDRGIRLVGREAELTALDEALSAARADGHARLATVIAEPGLGKTSLVRELARRAPEARVVAGRCLPYGRGITFWPIIEIVGAAAGLHEDDHPDEARAKIDALVPDAPDVAARIASAIGLADAEFPVDEIAWAARKLVEALAAEQPLVVHVDDIHWAEEAFLQLLRHVADTAEAPVLLLCTARPELLERDPDWAAEAPARRVELAPLTEADIEELVVQLLGGSGLPPAVHGRVAAAAQGNPLFVEQLVAMLVDDGALEQGEDGWRATDPDAELAIPGSIHALLSARLDLLSAEERAVVEPASVIGTVFPQEALLALVADAVRDQVDGLLAALTPKRLLRRTHDELLGASYRFEHLLVRETAYSRLLKRARATLHAKFVDWADAVNRDRARELEFAEILGYHLEQAYHYLEELGTVDEEARALARRGAHQLGTIAGRRAFARGDMGAAANLLRRAATLLPEDSPERAELLPDLGEAMMELGEFAWAEVYLDEAATTAETVGDERLRADAVLTRLLVRHHTLDDLTGWRVEVERETAALIPTLEELGAAAELAKAWRMVSFVHGIVCHWEATAAAQERALQYAREAGKRRQEARLAGSYTVSLTNGPTGVDEAIERCEEIAASGLVDRQAEALALSSLSYLYALQGSFEDARDRYRQARRLLEELGTPLLGSQTSMTSARVELLAGDAAAAERDLRRDFDALGELGERYFRPYVGALLTRALLAQERLDDAATVTAEVAAMADEEDVESQSMLRAAQARIAAGRGEHAVAVPLAREAVRLIEETDDSVSRAEALVDLALVLRASGLADEARDALEQARSLVASKGARPLEERVAALLEELAVNA
jgi:predicted ATPase/class 3 adenylate cyclase